MLAPFRFTGIQVDARHIDKLIEQRFVTCDVGQVLAHSALEIDVENRTRRLVRGAYPQVRIDCYNARRQPRKYDFEVGPLRFDKRLAETGLAPCCRETLGHVVKRIDKKPYLVARRRRQSRIEIACGDCPRTCNEVLDRRDEPP